MSRYQSLYTHALGLGSDRRRHLIHSAGSEISFPRGLCTERVILRDDAAAHQCAECRQIALTELSLALDRLGLNADAIRVAAQARGTPELPVAPV